MNTDDLEKAIDLMKPVIYAGQGPCGFVFHKGKPWEGENFRSLGDAYATYGDRIQIVGDSISSPRFHSGYNMAMFEKPYFPQTRISDGAPRVLTPEEIMEYDYGYLHGIQMRTPIKIQQ